MTAIFEDLHAPTRSNSYGIFVCLDFKHVIDALRCHIQHLSFLSIGMNIATHILCTSQLFSPLWIVPNALLLIYRTFIQFAQSECFAVQFLAALPTDVIIVIVQMSSTQCHPRPFPLSFGVDLLLFYLRHPV